MLKKYYLEFTVFICGAVVMIFELYGSRVLAPHLGTSIFVWTSLIGVILGSLSLGYWLGGKLSDKNASIKEFSLLVFISGILVVVTILVKMFIFNVFAKLSLPIELGTLFISTFLFAPASIFLGMISPYAVKLKMKSLEETGATVGNLYALSTVGSIIGTFFAGFFLIPHMGTTRILILLAAVLVINALIIFPLHWSKTKAAIIIILIFSFKLMNVVDSLYEKSGLIDVDTKYNRVLIYEGIDNATKRKTLNLMTDPFGTQSAIFLEGPDDLVFSYMKFFRLAEHFNPNINKSLLLGGAAYAYPRDFIKQFPNATMDVVEIDEKFVDLAKKYFKFKDDPRLSIYHQDGREFLNKTANKYDVVYGDAFQSMFSIPYQLTTKETVEKIYSSLNKNGVVMLNLASAIEGDGGKFLRAEYATYKNIFPQVFIFPMENMNGEKMQNIMLVALKSAVPANFESKNVRFAEFLNRLWKKEIKMDVPILTDEFAPVDYYIREII